MKKFLIIGNGNAVTYKEVFPLIKDNQIWLGASKGMGGSMVFLLDEELYDESKQTATRKEEGKYCISVMLATWLTNIEHNKKNHPLELTRHYNEEEYPKYGNYDAIEVGKVKYIPCDYDGLMGVPITFLDKYNPEQFEIVGCPAANVLPQGWQGMSKEFVDLYYAQGGTGQCQVGKRLEYYITSDGKAKVPYRRILIKRRNNY